MRDARIFALGVLTGMVLAPGALIAALSRANRDTPPGPWDPDSRHLNAVR